MQQHHGVDDQIRRFQRALRGNVAGKRRVAAVGGHVVAHGLGVIERRQLYRIYLRPQTLCGIHRGTHGARIGVVALEHCDALSRVDFRQFQHVLEHLGQFAIANRHHLAPRHPAWAERTIERRHASH